MIHTRRAAISDWRARYKLRVTMLGNLSTSSPGLSTKTPSALAHPQPRHCPDSARHSANSRPKPKVYPKWKSIARRTTMSKTHILSYYGKSITATSWEISVQADQFLYFTVLGPCVRYLTLSGACRYQKTDITACGEPVVGHYKVRI